jgi:hypothetical protein
VERAGLEQANSARAGAGLRAGGRTGLGDCQSKGWSQKAETGGEPMPDPVTLPIGIA